MAQTKFTFLSDYTELEATSLTIGSNVLYVTDGKSSGKGFATVDIGNPIALTLKTALKGSGYSGYLDATSVSNLVYTIDKDARLTILDSNNPIKPQLDSTSVNYKDDAYSLSVVGNKVYVAAGASGFSIFDVSNYNISTIATYDAAEVKDVAVVGNVAYLASGEKGLQLADVTKPNAVIKNNETTSEILKTIPVFSIIDTNGSATNVEISGNIAYVADGYNGLVSIDVSSPSSPKLLGGYDTLGYANNITISGNTAYISDYDKGVTIVDISNPSQMQLIGTYQTLGNAIDTAVSNGVLYIAEGEKGVEVVKMTEIVNPAGNDLPTGAVTISGKVAQGEVLTASNTLDDVDGLGAISYQWLSDGQPITGATTDTYTLTQAEVGKNISVKASYTDLGNTLENLISNTELVKEPITNNTVEGTAGSDNLFGTNDNDYIIGKGGNDVIDGGAGDDVIEGGLGKDTLTGGAGNDTFVYKSLDEGYFETITDFSVGDVLDFSAIKNIRFLDAEPSSASKYDSATNKLSPIAWSDSDGSYFNVYGESNTLLYFSKPVFLEQTTPTSGIFKMVGGVDNTNYAPTGKVVIHGKGQTLSVSNTLADSNGLGDVHYQWLSDGKIITGATQSTYTFDTTDVGNTISVTASYTDGLGKVESVNNAVSLTIFQQNQNVESADKSNDYLFNFQWVRDGTRIDGATQSSYTLTQDDVGKIVNRDFIYINDVYKLGWFSGFGVMVTNVNDEPTGSVTISGETQQSKTLTASNTLADADGLGIISYQWFADDEFLPNATQTTYNLTQADVGKTISVKASYIDGGGTLESVTSNETMAIKTSANGLTKTGDAKNNKLEGTAKNDDLSGLAGNDVLIGKAGNDRLNGENGKDSLTGGAGFDELTGGSGADKFIFTDIKDAMISRANIDVIADFNHKEGDKIDLSVIDANTAVKKDQAFSKPIIGDEFSGEFAKAGQLFFETSTSILYGNVNKDGAADFAIQLNGVSSLVAADFVL